MVDFLMAIKFVTKIVNTILEEERTVKGMRTMKIQQKKTKITTLT